MNYSTIAIRSFLLFSRALSETVTWMKRGSPDVRRKTGGHSQHVVLKRIRQQPLLTGHHPGSFGPIAMSAKSASAFAG
jgi:hypothetical protein